MKCENCYFNKGVCSNPDSDMVALRVGPDDGCLHGKIINPKKPMIGYHMCAECGKSFLVENKSKWAYKGFFFGKKQLFCSWKCLDECRTEYENEKRRKLQEAKQ